LDLLLRIFIICGWY